MRPILALNCLLQVEQERSEKERSVGGALALAFCCAHFCSVSLTIFALYSLAPLLMRPRYFAQSCAIYTHNSVGMLCKSYKKSCGDGPAVKQQVRKQQQLVTLLKKVIMITWTEKRNLTAQITYHILMSTFM